MSQVKLTDIRRGLEEPHEGYFVKYDGVHGAAVSPDSDVSISKLEYSVFDPDYK